MSQALKTVREHYCQPGFVWIVVKNHTGVVSSPLLTELTWGLFGGILHDCWWMESNWSSSLLRQSSVIGPAGTVFFLPCIWGLGLVQCSVKSRCSQERACASKLIISQFFHIHSHWRHLWDLLGSVSKLCHVTQWEDRHHREVLLMGLASWLTVNWTPRR